MERYSYYENCLCDNKGNKVGLIAFLFGGMNSHDPKGFMDNAVHDYLQKRKNPLYNQFVEIHMDNPWLRVIVVGINELPFTEETFEI